MGISKEAPPVLIIDSIPIPLWTECANIESVTESNMSNLSVQYAQGNTPYYLLGSSMRQVSDPINSAVGSILVQKNNLTVNFNVEFYIENKGKGAYLTELLMPLLKVTRKAFDIPCQFIYNGFYMLLGYLQDYEALGNPDEGRINYKLSFIENIYRTFTDETDATYLTESNDLSVPNSTA